jgi:hypothetical protein
MPVVEAVANAIFGFVSDTISFIGEWKDEILLAAGILGALWLAANVATIGVTLLTLKMKIMSGVTKVATTIQGAFNAIMALNPIGLVVMAIAALALGVIYCWNKFAGFRAFLRSTWAVLKELGGVIKTYVTDRVTELIGALGDVGEMFKLFFTGKWEAAAEKAKSAFTKLSGVNSAKNLVSGTKGAIEYGKNYYNASLEEEQKKEESEVPTEESFLEKIQNMTLPPDGEYKLTGKGGEGGKGGKGGKTGKGDKKTASAAATGGQRSTKIEMHIGKFFDQMNVYMMDRMDTAELERAIVQSMNRALAIATSTDR